MTIDCSTKFESYRIYKARIFKSRKDKITMLLNGISDLNLKQQDKVRLLNVIKKIVKEY